MTKCSRYVGLIASDSNPEKHQFARIACKQWDCEDCSKRMQKKWRFHLMARVSQMQDRAWWFVTLTAPGYAHSEKITLKKMQSGLAKLLPYLVRTFDKCEYARVYETHPTSDEFHAHAIVSGLPGRVFIDTGRNGKTRVSLSMPEKSYGDGKVREWSIKTFLKERCVEFGLGYIIDTQELREPTHAVWYVTKYMTKSAQEFDAKHLRRVATSAGLALKKPPKSKLNWYLIDHITETDVYWHGRRGRAVWDIDEQKQVTSDDFTDEIKRYPSELS